MPQAQNGNTVKVHYTGKLNDGSVFESSRGKAPLEFTLGNDQLIPGFEKAVIGMEVGETRSVVIPADEAYGRHLDEMILEVKRDQLPPDLVPEVGQQLQSKQSDGQIAVFTVTEVNEDSIKVDANHPLAGQDLTFDIELMEIL
jgi:FKBP-type peptidyl-prolyl cis-trans isomerase 2